MLKHLLLSQKASGQILDRTSVLAAALGGGDVADCVWTGSQFVLSYTTGKTAVSPDGLSWQFAANPLFAAPTKALVTLNDTIIQLCEQGYVATSTNGTTWTSRTGLRTAAGPNANNFLTAGAAVRAGRIVAAASTGHFAYSDDGITWTFRHRVGTANGALQNTTCIGLGFGERLLAGAMYVQYGVSIDSGHSWSAHSIPKIAWTNNSAHINAVKATQLGTFIVGTFGLVLIDGEPFQKMYQNIPTWYEGSYDIVDAIDFGPYVVLVDRRGRLAKTLDGTTWTYHTGAYNLQNPLAVYVAKLATDGKRLLILGKSSHVTAIDLAALH